MRLIMNLTRRKAKLVLHLQIDAYEDDTSNFKNVNKSLINSHNKIFDATEVPTRKYSTFDDEKKTPR